MRGSISRKHVGFLNTFVQGTGEILIKFNKEKYKVLHLERNSLVYQDMPGDMQLESSLAVKDLEVLVDNKLNTSQQCALATKKVNILDCIRDSIASSSRKVILSLYFALLRSYLELYFQFWALHYKGQPDIMERVQ